MPLEPIEDDDFDPGAGNVWRRGWRPKLIFGAGAAIALVGLVWAASWAYTGQVWPEWARSDSGNHEELASLWPDRQPDGQKPGGGEGPPPPGAVEYVLMVSSGFLPEDPDEEAQALARWARDQDRLQERLNEEFPDDGLVVINKLVEGHDNLIGLFVFRWYAENDPNLIQVQQWVRSSEKRFAQASVHSIGGS